MYMQQFLTVHVFMLDLNTLTVHKLPLIAVVHQFLTVRVFQVLSQHTHTTQGALPALARWWSHVPGLTRLAFYIYTYLS